MSRYYKIRGYFKAHSMTNKMCPEIPSGVTGKAYLAPYQDCKNEQLCQTYNKKHVLAEAV